MIIVYKMTTIIIADKNGLLKELKIKTYCVEDLYKKAGFKTSVDFIKHHVFDILLNDVTYSISLYGKTKGRANQENKYDFPPPVDNELFFGNCLLINNDKSGNPINLSLDDWNNVYDYLFKGFHECDGDSDSDSESESESDLVDPSLMTKDGYMRDKFIVDDDDYYDESICDSNEGSSNGSENERKKYNVKNKKMLIEKNLPLKKKVVVTKKHAEVEEGNYLDCSCELTSEEYFK